MNRLPTAWSAACALAVLLLPSGCGQAPPPRPNIILIVADTLRPDHVGYYGYSQPTTPRLDELAADSVAFSRAYCDMPLTPSSHASLFTGIYTDAHGVFHRAQEGEGGFYALKPSIPTLPECLQKAGYCCGAVVSSAWLDGKLGFSRGFEIYETYSRQLQYADLVNQRGKAVAGQLKRKKDCDSIFLFLHYYDPHSDWSWEGNLLPYYAPAEYITRFKVDRDLALSLQPESGKAGSKYLGWLARNSEMMTPEMLTAIIGLYDAGVACLDDSLGRTIEWLKETGAYDDTMIIVTADHGEEFLEHGSFIHNQVYEENIRVPLLIKFPGNRFAGERVEAPVELIDLLPTLLDYLQLPVPAHIRGRSLLDLIAGEPGDDRMTFARQKSPATARIYSVSDGTWKLVYDINQDRTELFNLVQDPGEQDDLALSHPQMVARLRRRLLTQVEENLRLNKALGGKGAQLQFSPERIDELKALGYM